MKLTALGLAATFAMVGGAQAASLVLVDDFESYNSVGDDMNGKGGWIVSNGSPADPINDGPVVILDNSTWDGSAQSASVGGVAQTALGITSLSNSTITVPMAGTLANPSSFKFETRYTESLGADPRNPFTFVLTADSGNLLTINLTPGAAGVYNFAWTSDFDAGTSSGTVSAGNSTQYQMNTWWNGSAMEYDFSTAGTPIKSGTLTGVLESASLTSFAVNWDSTGGAGGNSITIDKVSLVPEPSTSLLFGLAALGFAARRRRA